MLLTDLITLARQSFLDDGMAPYAWTDEVLALYASEAEREACRRAEVLVDSTTALDLATVPLPLCSVTVVAATASYTISQKILRIKSGYLNSNSLPLKQKTPDWLDEYWPEWRLQSGTPAYYLQDKGIVTLVPKPVIVDVLKLTVSRLPLSDLDMGLSTSALTIPEEYHFGLVDWICYLAYSRQDADSNDFSKSALHERRFDTMFGPRPSAKAEQSRRRIPKGIGSRPKVFGLSQ